MLGTNQCQHGRLKRSCPECGMAEEIEELRTKLAESQAREAKLREALAVITTNRMDTSTGILDSLCDNGYSPEYTAEKALSHPTDDTALQEALKQAKREALIEAASRMDANHLRMLHECLLPSEELRRLAEEIK